MNAPALIDAPGVYDLPHEVYHADPVKVPSLSNSLARTLVERSPQHAWHEHPRLNPDHDRDFSQKFDTGSAFHALLLEGADRMLVVDAKDWRTDAAKVARDSARRLGQYPVLAPVYRDIMLMRESALRAIEENKDLGGLTLADGDAEKTLIWREGDDEDAIWCRARPDWMLRGSRRVLLDAKTTEASAHPVDWLRTMAGLAGELQGAFYLRGNEATGGDEEAKWLWLVIETSKPYACTICGMPPAMKALGNSKALAAIDLWRRCMKAQKWPGYPRSIFWLEPSPLQLARWEERGLDLSPKGTEEVGEQAAPHKPGPKGKIGLEHENDPLY